MLDFWISFGSAFQRIIDRGTKLANVDDFLVAGTGYPDFRNVGISRRCMKLAGEEVCISTAVQDLIYVLLPWTKKKKTILGLEIRSEKNAVPRVISCPIRRDQRRAKVADSRGSDLPCADRAWSSMISHEEQRSSRRESRWWFFFFFFVQGSGRFSTTLAKKKKNGHYDLMHKIRTLCLSRNITIFGGAAGRDFTHRCTEAQSSLIFRCQTIGTLFWFYA